jgi:peptide deformylase
MAVRPILRLGDPRLRVPAEPVPDFLLRPGADSQSLPAVKDLRQLVNDLIETMRAANGAGIAAPQIGVSLQVCVIEVKKNERYPSFPEIPLTVLVNPLLTPLGQSYDVLAPADAISVYEGCLSVPGLRGRVSRPRRVRVQAKDANGSKLDEVWEGAKAAVVQHEVDHLHGTLFVDRADTSTLCFIDEYERFVPFTERVVDAAE